MFAAAWVERGIYKICGINLDAEQRWNVYVMCLLVFTVVGTLG